MSSWKENIVFLPAEKVIIPQNDPEKPYYNPSLVRYRGKLLMSIRSSTWTLGKGGMGMRIIGGRLHTDILLAEVNEKNLTISNIKKIPYAGDLHPYIAETGLEDVRLYVRDDKLYGIGVCMTQEGRNAKTVHMGRGEIKNGKFFFEEVIPKPNPDKVEKNWTIPTEPTDKFDYIYSPTQIVKDDEVIGEKDYRGLLHGGTQAIPFEDGWLSFMHKVHKTHFSNMQGFRQYTSNAIKFNEDGFATHISQGFILMGDNQVEFISGLVLDDDGRFLVSVGVGDAYCVLARIDPSDLKFEEFNPNQEPIRAYMPEGVSAEFGNRVP